MNYVSKYTVPASPLFGQRPETVQTGRTGYDKPLPLIVGNLNRTHNRIRIADGIKRAHEENDKIVALCAYEEKIIARRQEKQAMRAIFKMNRTLKNK